MSSEQFSRLWLSRRLVASGGAFLLALALAARAAEGEGFVALYAAYWAGLPAAKIRISAQETGGGYRDRIDIETEGLPWLFTRFRTTARAQGRLLDGRPVVPLRYDALFDLRRAKNRRISMRFVAREGGLVAERGPGDTSGKGPLAQAFRRNVLDPLSAFESIREALLRDRATRRRSFRIPVYDGARRFDVLGHFEAPPGRKGGALEVRLTLSAIAGFKGRTGHDIDPDNAPRPVSLRVSDDARLAPLSMQVSLYYLPLVVELERFCKPPDGCGKDRVFR